VVSFYLVMQTSHTFHFNSIHFPSAAEEEYDKANMFVYINLPSAKKSTSHGAEAPARRR
jgi:hypothetical protein